MTVWIQSPFDSLPQEGHRRERYWLMAEALAAAGHEVIYFTGDFSHVTKCRRKEVVSGNPSISIVMLPTRPYHRNVGLARLLSHRAYAREWMRAAISLGIKSPSVIISSFPTISAASAAVDIGRRFEAKVVIDIQDAWPQTFERLAPQGMRWLAKLLLWPLHAKAGRIFKEADWVTGTSERYRELVGRSDYYRAYLGIDLESALPAKSQRDAQSRIRIAYAGNLGRTYDLKTAVKAVEGNPDFELEVAGFGNFATTCSRVRFRGMLSSGELQKMLDGCDVGLIPMRADSWVGLPNKLFDYSASGLAVVSSLAGETEELIGKYRCGATYRPGDSVSLASAVRQAMALKIGGSRMMCEAEFSAKVIYADYVRMLMGKMAND